jgi:hypothetical protein
MKLPEFLARYLFGFFYAFGFFFFSQKLSALVMSAGTPEHPFSRNG